MQTDLAARSWMPLSALQPTLQQRLGGTRVPVGIAPLSAGPGNPGPLASPEPHAMGITVVRALRRGGRAPVLEECQACCPIMWGPS